MQRIQGKQFSHHGRIQQERYPPPPPTAVRRINKALFPYHASGQPSPSSPDDHLPGSLQRFVKDVEIDRDPYPDPNHPPIDSEIEMLPIRAFLFYRMKEIPVSWIVQNRRSGRYGSAGKIL